MDWDRYHTALEIAELAQRLGVTSVPWTKRRVQDLAAREGWDQSPLARPRNGRGGGMEYQARLLPERLTNAMDADERRQVQLTQAKQAMAAEQHALAALAETGLNGRQRMVMEARAAILNEVQAHTVEHQCRPGKSIDAIVAKAETDPKLRRLAATANDRGGKGRVLSRAAIYRWMKDHREGGITALAPKTTRETHAFPHWFTVFLNYYARPQAPTIAQAMEDMRAHSRLNQLPSYDQVRRCLKKLDRREGTQARHRGREGTQAIKARHAYVIRDTTGLLPTSVYTADGKTFDAEIQHPDHGRPFRPEITSILDVATRKCVGWSAGLAENAHDVRDALRVSVEWNGVPAIFYVDRGPGFKNDALDNELTGFCGRMGITKMHSLPYNSQARGIIERFNGPVYTKLAKRFETYIGADMDRQARQLAFKRTRRDLAEVGTSSLLPTWDDFLRAVGEAIEVYNDTPHDGLTRRDASGRKVTLSPNQAWDRAEREGFEAVRLSPHEIDDLFRPYVRRRTRRAMVEFLTNRYFHLDLEPYDGLDVLVGHDVHDASKVWVREIDMVNGAEQPGRLIAVADFEGNKARYVPLSAEQAAIEKRASARLRRLDAHRDEIEAEANPHRFLSQTAQSPLSIVDAPVTIDPSADMAPSPPPSSVEASIRRAVDPDARPHFSDDDAFCRWCEAHPDRMTEKDRAHLQSMLRSKRAREFLRVHGHDLDALAKLTGRAA